MAQSFWVHLPDFQLDVIYLKWGLPKFMVFKYLHRDFLGLLPGPQSDYLA